MKQLCRLLAVCALACVILSPAGCSKQIASHATSTWDLASAEPVYVTQWPENVFTAQIAEPETGEIAYVYDYSESGRYCIVMRDMSEEAASAYIRELQELGYSELASEGNHVSVGTMLHQDNVYVSIAHSGTMLSMVITIEQDP